MGRKSEPALEVIEPPVEPTIEVTEAQATERRRKRMARKPDGLGAEVSKGKTAKLSIMLPIKVWWRLKHHMADKPGTTEGEVIAPLLDEYLGQFDYPRQPDWLNQAIGRATASPEEASAA